MRAGVPPHGADADPLPRPVPPARGGDVRHALREPVDPPLPPGPSPAGRRAPAGGGVGRPLPRRGRLRPYAEVAGALRRPATLGPLVAGVRAHHVRADVRGVQPRGVLLLPVLK